MTNPHPIAPPPELVQQWTIEYTKTKPNCLGTEFVATRAAQYGADQELEACCEWLNRVGHFVVGGELRAARRPKPPSLKEKALALLQPGEPRLFNSEMQDTIRRALEQLDD